LGAARSEGVTDAPLLLPIGDVYQICAPWRDVPSGFRTNGASIPRALWPFLGSPFDPRLIAAAVLHDHAYQFGVPARREADDDFALALREAGVGTHRASLLFLGVRLFGWLYWRRCRFGRGIAA